MIKAFLCLIGSLVTSLGAVRILSQASSPSQPWWGFWAYMWLSLFAIALISFGIYFFAKDRETHANISK